MKDDLKGFIAARPRVFASLIVGVTLALISVVPALANPVRTDLDPPLECPSGFGSGVITTYLTTVNMPADSEDWWVSVEVTIANEPGGGVANCELTLATYELAGPAFSFPQTLHASQTGTFGAGTHTLTADLPVPGELPDCFSQYDFVFGPAIDQLVFENRYGDRQIRSRIVPDSAAECPVIEVQPQQPTPTPSPTPRQQELGGTPQPTPRGQVAAAVPNTNTTPGPTNALALIGGVLVLTSLGALTLSGVRNAHAKRR